MTSRSGSSNLSIEEWAQWQRGAYRWRRQLMRAIVWGFLSHVLWKVTVEGLEHVPAAGPGVLMMSHSTMADTTVPLGVVTHRDIVPMTKEENFQNPATHWLLALWGAYSIRRGEVDRQALQTTVELLRIGELVMIMPEGTRSPTLRKAKDGLAYVLLRADVPVIPAAVWGLEDFRRDLFKPWKRTPVTIRFGQPFRLKEAGERVPREVISAITREMMYQLARLYPEHKRGFYADLSQLTTDHLLFT